MENDILTIQRLEMLRSFMPVGQGSRKASGAVEASWLQIIPMPGKIRCATSHTAGAAATVARLFEHVQELVLLHLLLLFPLFASSLARDANGILPAHPMQLRSSDQLSDNVLG